MNAAPLSAEGPPTTGRAVPSAPLQPQQPRRIDSQQLFGCARELEIAHDGAVYRLRRTALGKLILTK